MRWLERGLLVAGAAALIWCGVFVADMVIAQRHARRAAPTAPASVQPVVAPALEEVTEPAPRTSTADAGSAIATLSIPRIRLSAAVLHGSDARTLRRGPGHLEHTAYPGETGNVVIAGHRDTFFRPLRNIRAGDDIFLDGSRGRVRYEVTSVKVVNAHDVSVLAPTENATLTLITCYPFWVLGHAPDRFIVRATRVDVPSPALLESRVLLRPDVIETPMPKVAAAGASVPVTAPTVVASDDALVQEAVERYFLTYHAQIARHAGVPSHRHRPVDSCDIAVAGDEATATCAGSIDSPSTGAVPGRTFRLERTADGWAIRTVVLHGPSS